MYKAESSPLNFASSKGTRIFLNSKLVPLNYFLAKTTPRQRTKTEYAKSPAHGFTLMLAGYWWPFTSACMDIIMECNCV